MPDYTVSSDIDDLLRTANDAAARTELGVDAAGTDNSTDVTLTGAGTYISIGAGQIITVDAITESDIDDLGAYITGITGSPLSDLSDVTITTPAADQILKWDGAAWVNTTITASIIDAEASTDGQVLTSDGAGNVAWETPAGSGDMLASTYDPNTVAGDAFAMDNMVEGTTTKILTDIERAAIASALQSADIDTLAELNAIVADATIDDSGDARTPTAHAASHTDGSDDIQDATNLVKGLATAAHITAIEANTTHRTSDGSDHTFIDQDVTSGSSPTLDALNITNVQTAALPFGTAGQQLTTNEAETALELSLASKYLLSLIHI